MTPDSYVKCCPVCGKPVGRKVIHGRDRRIMEPKRGLWSLPAGFVDADEDPVEAAAREVYEETGLNVEIDGLLDVIYGKEHPNGASIVILYKGKVKSGRLQAGDDVDAVDFFDPAQLPPLAFEATRRALQHLRQS
jgi:8-oxo-dGTP diphosphatase